VKDDVGRGWVAFAIGLLSAVTLYCIGMAVEKSYQPAIFCSPFFVGAIVGLFAGAHAVRNAIVTVLVALGLAIVTLQEGVICCLFALPLVLPVTILGALCTSTIRRWVRGRNARAAVWSLLMLAGVTWQTVEGLADNIYEHPVHRATSAVVVAAPPEQVWTALTSGDLRVRQEWPWFLRIGLPMPSRLRVIPPGNGGGFGVVEGTFDHGVAGGIITRWEPARTLEYDITRYAIIDEPFHITRLHATFDRPRPENPKEWLSIDRTRYDLEPLPGGQTRLRREMVWRRHLAPAFYFGWLQQTIIQRGQDRLLELVRERVVCGEERSPDLVAGQEP
jgi:hypothetical protein